MDVPAEEERVGQRVSAPVDVSGTAPGRAAFPSPIGIEISDQTRDRLLAIVRVGRGSVGSSGRLAQSTCDAGRDDQQEQDQEQQTQGASLVLHHSTASFLVFTLCMVSFTKT